MFKKLLSLLFIAAAPVYAGSFESALSEKKDVLLYLYTQDCIMCKRFNPRFEQLKKTYPDIKFLSVDAQTSYGMKLMSKFRGRYVPFLVITGHKSGKSAVINPSCSIDDLCMARAIKGITK